MDKITQHSSTMVMHDSGIMVLMQGVNLVSLYLKNTLETLVHIKTSQKLKYEFHVNAKPAMYEMCVSSTFDHQE